MSWGIWKKIKQGITKVADFGKKIVRKLKPAVEKGLKIADDVMPILDKNGIDTSKIKPIIDKTREVAKITGKSAVNFGGKSWSPKLL